MRTHSYMRRLALFMGLVAAFAITACKKEKKDDQPAPSNQTPQQVSAKVDGSSVSFTSTVAAAYDNNAKEIAIVTKRKDGSDEWQLTLILKAPTSRQDTTYNGSGPDDAELITLTKNPTGQAVSYTMGFNSSARFQFSISGNTVQGTFSASNLEGPPDMGGNTTRMSLSDGSFKATFVR